MLKLLYIYQPAAPLSASCYIGATQVILIHAPLKPRDHTRTLNVRLPFAQFEREVTGERIRDRIATSKAKGMWMGDNLPLGYDLSSPGTRMLRVNMEEAKTVRLI